MNTYSYCGRCPTFIQTKMARENAQAVEGWISGRHLVQLVARGAGITPDRLLVWRQGNVDVFVLLKQIRVTSGCVAGHLSVHTVTAVS